MTVDGDKLMMWLSDWWYSSFGEEETEEAKAIRRVMDKVEESLSQFETPEHKDRAKGEWKEKEHFATPRIEEWQSAYCSICGKYHTTPYAYYFINYDYCPNCGALMSESLKAAKIGEEIARGIRAVIEKRGA